jgi:hypothetical protein
MSDSVEMAQETFEHAHHEAERKGGEGRARTVAVLTAVLAAALALAEMGEKGAQNEYLTHHIALSDDYNYYQAKRIREQVLVSDADVLASLPQTDETRARVSDMRAEAQRLQYDPKGGEGWKQLLDRANRQRDARDEQFHRYHHFELVTGALQIAIVLASVSIVTRVGALAVGGAVLGAIAAIFGLLVAGGLA